MVRTTRKQREALFRIFQRDWPDYVTPTKRQMGTVCPHCGHLSSDDVVTVASNRYRNFRKQITRYGDGSGCVMLPWKSMWLGIETDGYVHS